jgi:DNA-binding NarL/FixJ family response regulator
MTGNPGPLRVLIIEKQMLFAKAVAQVLSADPDVKVVGIAAGRDSAALTKDVDIVVIDIDTEEIDDVVEHFKNRSPGVKICALSAHTQGELMQHCLCAGADAYIVKDASLQELQAAIKSLGEGSSYVDPRVAASRAFEPIHQRALTARTRDHSSYRARSFEPRHRAPVSPVGEDDQESRQSHLCKDSLYGPLASRRSRDSDRAGLAGYGESPVPIATSIFAAHRGAAEGA